MDLENVKSIIQSYELNKENRDREYVYKRAYVYSRLRETGMSYSAIGRLFGHNHATVMHGIRNHEFYTKMNDAFYLNCIREIRKKFETEKYRDIFRDVLNCNNSTELALIKKRIENKEY